MDVSTLEGTSKGMRNPVSAFTDTVRQMRRDDASATGEDAQSKLTAADSTSVPYILSGADADKLVSELRAHARKMAAEKKRNKKGSEDLESVDDFYLLSCLRARKGSVERAYALLCNYVKWRRDAGYDAVLASLSSAQSKVGRLLRTGLFVVAGNETLEHRPCLVVRYRFFNPREFAALDVALAIGIVVEYVLRTYPNAQSHGLAVVDDMAGFAFGNFDIRVFKFLEKAFTQVMPMRLASISVCNPGWIVRTIFSLVAGFMSKKIQARITIVDAKDTKKMAKLFAKDQIPSFLNMGGTLQWGDTQQNALVDDMQQKAQDWIDKAK